MTDHDRQPTTEQPTVQQPGVSADVGTDRQRSPWRIKGIPSHLGRARTSTVVLSLLFLAIGTLYLQIRPDPPGRAPVSDAGTEQPADPTGVPETTPPEETDPAPTTGPTTTTGSPSTPTRTPTGTPDGTTPEETTDEEATPTSPADGQTGTGTGTAPG